MDVTELGNFLKQTFVFTSFTSHFELYSSVELYISYEAKYCKKP